MKKLTSGHLMILSGQGDTYVTLVGPATFTWIMSDAPNFKTGSYTIEETPSQEVLDEFIMLNPHFEHESLPFNITSGSYDNDRALNANGKEFESVTSAVKWAIHNDIELGEEYHGCVY